MIVRASDSVWVPDTGGFIDFDGKMQLLEILEQVGHFDNRLGATLKVSEMNNLF